MEIISSLFTPISSDEYIFEICKNRLDSYSKYINKLIDNEQDFSLLEYDRMIRDFEFIKELNIDKKINDYCIYILDRLEEFDFHHRYKRTIKKYIRNVKLKKISLCNDTKD